jgi:hypothetical protein
MSNHNEAWGKADQKMILVHNNDFTEVQEHLESGWWFIESISACPYKVFDNINTSCYVVLNKN